MLKRSQPLIMRIKLFKHLIYFKDNRLLLPSNYKHPNKYFSMQLVVRWSVLNISFHHVSVHVFLTFSIFPSNFMLWGKKKSLTMRVMDLSIHLHLPILPLRAVVLLVVLSQPSCEQFLEIIRMTFIHLHLIGSAAPGN